MTTWNKGAKGLVVGVDGSSASNAAVAWAARDAAMRKVPLTLVHMLSAYVPTFPQIPLPGGVAVWQEDDGRQVLEEAAKLARESAGSALEIATELKSSPPIPTLVELSEGAEFVVVGSHGRGAFGRVLLGSVSSGVLRGAACPVAIVPGDEPAADAPVLVGIDGSPALEAATAIAFAEASRRGVGLMALHAWTDPWISGFRASFQDSEWDAQLSEEEESLAERLAGWHERYPDVAIHRTIEIGDPARCLIEASQRAQLLVVGSHGCGWLRGKLLGSVGAATVNRAKIPVIVARQS